MSTFREGSTFATFKEFERALDDYSSSTSSLFVKHSSLKMKDPLLGHLKYEYVRYACKQGKALKSSASSGARPNQK